MPSVPPHDLEHLPELDRWHQRLGTYEEWMLSKARADITGPKHIVRILTWKNMPELCQKAGLDGGKTIVAYREALATGDIIFVEYDEE